MNDKTNNLNAALRERAERQAGADLPHDTDAGTRAVYANLLWRKYTLEAEPEPTHPDRVRIEELRGKLQNLREREEQKFRQKQQDADRPPQGIAVGAAAFAGAAQYTKRGAAEQIIRVIPRADVDAFIQQIKDRAGGKADFKAIFALAAKKFALTKDNLDSPQNAHIKAALLHQRNLEKGEAEALKLETDIIPEEDVREFARTSGCGADDVVRLAELARQRFGVTAATLSAPRFRHVAALLVSGIANLGISDAAEAMEYLDILLS